MNTHDPDPNPKGRAHPIAERTRTNYLGAIKTAVRASVAKRTTDWEEPAIVSLTEVVTDYFSRKDQARSTQALLRSAFLWYIRSEQTPPNKDTDQALAILEAMEIQPGKRVSKSRPNTIPPEDLSQLLDVLYSKAARSPWSFRAATWIRAGLACGARPIEWLYSDWADTEQTSFRIRNAKVKLSAPAFLRQTLAQENLGAQAEPWQLDSLVYWEAGEGGQDPYDQGRSYRLIPIENGPDRQAVETHLQMVNQIIPLSLTNVEREAEFRHYHKQCTQAIERACQSIWAGRKAYTLYTMRGQFAANMKAAKGAKIAAELMGHSSETSPSAAHYGKGNQAHPMFKGTRKSPITEQLNQQLAQRAAPTEAGPVE